MIPANTPAEDAGLYFNRTYIHHPQKGLLYCERAGRSYIFRDVQNNQVELKGQELEMLNIWLPASTSFNVGASHAGYLSRKGERSMRKSFCMGHSHTLGWSSGSFSNTQILAAIYDPKKYPDPVKAYNDVTKTGKSRAICRSIILTAPSREDAHCSVIWHGMYTGKIKAENKYEDIYPNSLRAKRVSTKLIDLGVVTK